MRRGAGIWAALAAAALVLAAWVTTAGYVPAVRGAVPDKPHGRGFRQPTAVDHQTQTTPPPEGKSGKPFPLGIEIMAYALLGALLVLMAIVVARKVALIRRNRDERRELAEVEPLDDELALAPPEELAESAERGLTTLIEGEPRDAIVRCWTDLEDAVVALGAPRDLALTSEEFTAAVLDRYALDRGSIVELAALYREARFSRHPLVEDHRQRALTALRRLRDDLSRTSSDAPAPA